MLLFLRLLSLLVMTPRSVFGQWQPNGAPVSAGTTGDINFVVSDGAGGAYVAWRRIGFGSTDVWLQHLTPLGTIAPGWPGIGLPIAASPIYEDLQGLSSDGEGGAFVFWSGVFSGSPTGVDNVVQRVRADGSSAPGWPTGGFRILAPSNGVAGKIAPDGQGGVWVVWNDRRNDPTAIDEDVFALRLLYDGTVAPGWPADGLPICALPSYSFSRWIARGASDGAYFFWSDDRRYPDVFAEAFGQRVLGDGTLAPGWNANGNLLAPDQSPNAACEDLDGGFYLLSSGVNLFYSLFTDMYLWRYRADGALVPGWPAGGIPLATVAGLRDAHQMVPDGQDGVLIAWHEVRNGATEVYALRVLPSGAIAPGWTFNGTTVSDPALQTGDFTPFIAPDDQGGAYLVWDQNGPVKVQHMTATGQVAVGWPVGGVKVENTDSQFDGHITADGEGGAIVTWNRSTIHPGIWAQRYVMDGIVAAQLALVNASAAADVVRLEWFGADAAGLGTTVQRREEPSDWQALANVMADGTGRVRYEDRDVSAGQRYAYRLSYMDSGVEHFTAETWVDMPEAARLSLAGFRPNPAVGAPTVAFTLARSAPGRIELFDLAGRRVAEHDLASMPAGRHMIRMEPVAPLAPGAYVTRITHAGLTMTARGVVVR